MKKCIYGHPRSGKAFVDSLGGELERRGWKRQEFDSAVFLREGDSAAVYVDDVVASSSQERLDKVWEEIGERFKTKDAEPCKRFLGMQADRVDGPEERRVEISMKDYIESMLREYEGLFPDFPAVPCDTPATFDLREDFWEGPPQKPRQEVLKMIGEALWVFRCGRPEVGFQVSQLRQRVTKWTIECSRQLQRLMGYFKKYPGDVLTMTWKGGARIWPIVHVDADLAVPRSQSGLFFFLSDGKGGKVPIAWQSGKQSIAADSTAAAEIIAFAAGTKKVFAMTEALDDLDCATMTVESDNAETVRTVKRGFSKMLHAFSRAIKLKICMLSDLVAAKWMRIDHVPGSENCADLFTKRLPRLAFQKAKVLVGVRDPNDEVANYAPESRPASMYA